MTINKKQKRNNLSTTFFIFLISFSILLFYFPVLEFSFVWDDKDLYINEKNLPISNSLTTICEHFVPKKDKMYMPLTYIFWSLILAIEKSYNPFWFHLFNVVLHLANSLLVFFILNKFLQDKASILLGTLIFALHPIQIESVAWVSEARGLLSTTFGLLSIYFFLTLTKLKQKIFVIAALVFSMLSKPTGVVFPLIILIVDYYYCNTTRLKDLLLKNLPYLLASIPFVVIAYFAESTKTIHFEIPLYLRPIFWFNSIGFYLLKLFFPINSSPGYGLTYANVLRDVTLLFPSIFSLSLIILTILIRKKELLFALLLFTIGYLPVSNLLTFYYQYWSTVADRYIYFSVFGFSFFIAYLSSKHLKKNIYIIISIIAVIFFIINRTEIYKWKNDFTLWQDAIEKYPERIPHPYLGRGLIYESQGELNLALKDYSTAISLDSSYYFGYYNRGNVYLDLGQYDQAIKDFNKVIELNPKFVNAYVNRGLCNLSATRFESAISDFTKALELDSTQFDVFEFRGDAHFELGNFELALNDYLSALNLSPKNKKLQTKINSVKSRLN
ncbi:MAG: tetratricopeptide repeat protein [Ignavibacteria bacterium]|nr:tetratricopeptide repeat protein [Ignavibacteria bacterium]